MRHGARLSGRAGIGAFAAVAVVVLLLAACGNPAAAKVTPTRAASDSFSGLASQSGVTVTIGLGVTAARIQQMATTGGDALSAPEASSLAQTSISIGFNAGHGEKIDSKQADTDGADQFDFAMKIGTATPVEIRYLNGLIYIHADVPALLSDFGQPAADATKFDSDLQSINSYVPGITALGQGQWVSAQTAALSPLLNQVKTADPNAAASVSPAESKQLLNQLSSALKSNSTYTNEGTHGGRTEYAVTVQAHTFVQQVETNLASTLASIPGTSGLTKGLSGVNDKIPAGQTFVFDLWVQDNRAQEMDVDLNQFKHKYSFAIPLKIQFGAGAPIAPPPSATALNLSNLSSLLGGLLGGGLSSS